MDQQFRYDGKRALVVGAASGMGAATRASLNIDAARYINGVVSPVDAGFLGSLAAGFATSSTLQP
ncbi:MAG: hypothetical protein JO337_10810 [Acidimicrobiales bacterium]|nr:hypothetical protein [Acidimicrobiales bacterium]